MASADAFKYCVELQGRNIRLLEVTLGSELSTLEIRLIEESLDEERFEALSYVWGSQERKELVKYNGRWLSIGSNLHDALWGRRCRGSRVFLWADAICINQEKSRQVRMIRDIYAIAERVIIWIGKERSKGSDAFRLAKSLYHKYDGGQYDIDAGTYDFEDLDCKSKGVPEPLFDPTWSALFEIISHAWFARVWVI